MKNLLFCSIISCFIFHVTTVEIKMDPRMRDGSPSYIYCDVGTVTAGINFFTEPNTGKGLCLGPGAPCSSTLYTLTQNTTGALLEIPSVDVSREEGVWYCEHDTDRSTNTISLNDHTITGILLRQNWTERAGPVDTFSAVMTLSCASQAPNVSFTFKDSESNTGTVPPEAVSTTTKSLFDGTTCENGNKFYEITLTASNSLDVFNNKQGVRFSFNYYGNNITAPFSVNFTAFSESTTESPTTVCVCDVACTYVGGVLFGLGIGSYIIYTILIKAVPKKIKVLQIFFVVTMILACAAIIGGGTCTGVTVDKRKSCEGQICDTGLGLSAASLVAGIVVLVLMIFVQGMVMDSAGVSKRPLLGNFLHFPREKDEGNGASGEKTSTEMKNQNDHKKDDKKDDKKHDKKDDKEKKDEKNVERLTESPATDSATPLLLNASGQTSFVSSPPPGDSV